MFVYMYRDELRRAIYRDNGKEHGSDYENATLLAALCHSFVVRW